MLDAQDIGKGMVALTLLLAAYILLLTVFNGPGHALENLQRNGFLLFPLVILFGAQISLYSLARRTAKANPSMMAAGGVSAGSMAACCAHHALDVLPFMGIAGLAALLAGFEQAFLGLGILAGIFGLFNMLSVLEKNGIRVMQNSYSKQLEAQEHGSIL